MLFRCRCPRNTVLESTSVYMYLSRDSFRILRLTWVQPLGSPTRQRKVDSSTAVLTTNLFPARGRFSQCPIQRATRTRRLLLCGTYSTSYGTQHTPKRKQGDSFRRVPDDQRPKDSSRLPCSTREDTSSSTPNFSETACASADNDVDCSSYET